MGAKKSVPVNKQENVTKSLETSQNEEISSKKSLDVCKAQWKELLANLPSRPLSWPPSTSQVSREILVDESYRDVDGGKYFTTYDYLEFLEDEVRSDPEKCPAMNCLVKYDSSVEHMVALCERQIIGTSIWKEEEFFRMMKESFRKFMQIQRLRWVKICISYFYPDEIDDSFLKTLNWRNITPDVGRLKNSIKSYKDETLVRRAKTLKIASEFLIEYWDLDKYTVRCIMSFDMARFEIKS